MTKNVLNTTDSQRGETMLTIQNPIVGSGELIQLRIEGVDAARWDASSGIRVALFSDEGDLAEAFDFPSKPVLEIPTQSFPLGSYDLTVTLKGTAIEFTEPVFIGAPDLHTRVTRFVDALEAEQVAKTQRGEARKAGLLEVKKTYTDLGLSDLAEEVDKVLRPFDESRQILSHYLETGRRKSASVRAHVRPGSK